MGTTVADKTGHTNVLSNQILLAATLQAAPSSRHCRRRADLPVVPVSRRAGAPHCATSAGTEGRILSNLCIVHQLLKYAKKEPFLSPPHGA
eukprot:1981709-Pleurochrysis_carterae.AAC.2